MAMRRETGIQDDLGATWAEMPRSPGHAFYDRLQALLKEAGFDAFVEDLCKPYYAPRMGAPSLPPGRYFRMHMVGYFEGLDSEREASGRCSDSLSLREFLRLASRDKVADHSWLSKTRSRLPHEVHEKVFGWVLSPLRARFGPGRPIGVDGSTWKPTLPCGRSMRRDSGDTYRQMLANGQGERRRDADDRPWSAGSQPEGQETLEQGLDEPDGSGCEDRRMRRRASGLIVIRPGV